MDVCNRKDITNLVDDQIFQKVRYFSLDVSLRYWNTELDD